MLKDRSPVAYSIHHARGLYYVCKTRYTVEKEQKDSARMFHSLMTSTGKMISLSSQILATIFGDQSKYEDNLYLHPLLHSK